MSATALHAGELCVHPPKFERGAALPLQRFSASKKASGWQWWEIDSNIHLLSTIVKGVDAGHALIQSCEPVSFALQLVGATPLWNWRASVELTFEIHTSVALSVMGPSVLQVLGPRRFLLLYLASGIYVSPTNDAVLPTILHFFSSIVQVWLRVLAI